MAPIKTSDCAACVKKYMQNKQARISVIYNGKIFIHNPAKLMGQHVYIIQNRKNRKSQTGWARKFLFFLLNGLRVYFSAYIIIGNF